MTPRGRLDLPFGARPSGFFALRTPLLATGVLVDLSEGFDAAQRPLDDPRLADAVERALRDATARLRTLVRSPVVREALFLASPGFEEVLQAWLDEPDSRRAQGVTETVTRYLVRMTLRPTPFGLFAGCSTGTLAAHTRLRLDDAARWSRHARLDSHYVHQLTEALGRDEVIGATLRYRPNDAIWTLPDALRYPEARIASDTRERGFVLVSAARTEALDRALAAADGATLEQIAAALVDGETSRDEALAFVRELVAAQLLVPEIQPTVTGALPFDHLVDVLRARAPDAGETLVAARARESLRAIDAAPLGADPARYRALAADLADLPCAPELPRLYQVDLYKPLVESTLGHAVVRELAAAVAALRAMCPRAEPPELKRLREAFEARYEGREVPLLEALDDERGALGALDEAVFSPLLADIRFEVPEEASSRADPSDAWRAARLGQVLRGGALEWSLTEEDVAALRVDDPAPLPDAFAALCAVRAADGAAVDRGDFELLLQAVTGPSGARLLGRFCHGDEALREHVRAHLRAEEALRPDVVFAEVVHLPEGRMGNLVCRPLLRDWEIPFLGRSGAPREGQLPTQDLLLSVRAGRFVLRSASLGREVVPRMTSAHNFELGDFRLYRLLCLLQWPSGLPGWRWGSMEQAAFLPRVRIGRTVVSPARWRLVAGDLAPLAGPTPAARFASVQRLRAALSLPRWVAVSDADNILPFDLDHPLFTEALVAFARGRDELLLLEAPQRPGAEIVEGPGGRYTQEIIVPFVASRPAEPAASVEPARRSAGRPRRFAPGSEWLYARLYCGPVTADAVLTEVVAPLIERGRGEGWLRGWFFIRYRDEASHLRVRLRGDPAALLGRALPELHRAVTPWSDTDAVSRIELGTYEREVERYGGDEGVELAEALFEADSDAALAIVGAHPGDGGADARWRLTLLGMHRLLDDLGLDRDARLQALRAQRDAFAAEHGVDARVRREIGQTFRAARDGLQALLGMDDGALEEAGRAFAARSRALAPVVGALGSVRVPLEHVAGSYLHMHANRVLRARHRAHEAVLYDFLVRLYEGERARGRRGVSAEG